MRTVFTAYLSATQEALTLASNACHRWSDPYSQYHRDHDLALHAPVPLSPEKLVRVENKTKKKRKTKQNKKPKVKSGLTLA